MYRIIDGRGTGKTSRLLLLAKENNGIVVCQNPEAMREKAYRYGLTGIDFISYKKFADRDDDIEKTIYIDNLDTFVGYLIINNYTADFGGYTISNED